jgi:galactokinase
MDTQQLQSDFVKEFGDGGKIHVVRSPGRVNLIGEHTDYNDGFVFPMAIEPQVLFVCRARTDDVVRARSSLFPGSTLELRLSEKIAPGEPKWGNYLRGPIALLLDRGIPLVGMDCLVVNTLPMGGGLSSSAALEVGTTQAMLALAGETLDVESIAQLCQKAEHTFANVPCGIMDQTIVAGGRAGHAMLLDCRDFSKQFVPIDPADVSVVVVNSMVKHELSGGEYAERRAQCEEGVAILQKKKPAVKALRDATPVMIESARGAMSDEVFRRCRHVVTENARATQFARHLEAKQYDQAGVLMVQSHDSLRDDYEVSTPELDYLVETAAASLGCYGSRMTGGGFGGCTVSLVQPKHAQAFAEELKAAYKKKCRIDAVAFVTTATDGASLIV